MMKSGGESWSVYFIVEEYDPKLAEITSRAVFAHEATGEKWVREKLDQERRRIEVDNPGLPMQIVITECTAGAKFFGLESEGEEFLGYYLSPARFYP